MTPSGTEGRAGVAEHKWVGLRTMIGVFILIVATPVSPLLITQRWGWWQAWAFAALTVSGFFISRLLASRKHPDLLDERAKFLDHEDTEPFDKILSPIVGFGPALVPLCAGLEARFLGDLTKPLFIDVMALVAFVCGYVFGSWALLENRFFSGTVRIQAERGHTVVDTGPYRIVRHPGYSGALLVFLSTPVLFGTPWTALLTTALCVALVVRTALEDRALRDKLQGYEDYAARTRFRLVPGLW
ncbi:MAG: isoprenylcysteine carboxylmethyltransferase family protein [Polyangiaceae bacterium]